MKNCQDKRSTSLKRFACRREDLRRAIRPEEAVCWTQFDSPHQAVVIEADTRGARLVLPWPVEKDEQIAVSLCNSLGLYRTEKAKVAWTHRLERSGRTVVGLYFEKAA